MSGAKLRNDSTRKALEVRHSAGPRNKMRGRNQPNQENAANFIQYTKHHKTLHN